MSLFGRVKKRERRLDEVLFRGAPPIPKTTTYTNPSIREQIARARTVKDVDALLTEALGLRVAGAARTGPSASTERKLRVAAEARKRQLKGGA